MLISTLTYFAKRGTISKFAGTPRVKLTLILALVLVPASTFLHASDTGTANSSTPAAGNATETANGNVHENWNTGIHSLRLGTTERRFRIHVPPATNPSTEAPLILAFHGWGGNEHEFLKHPVVTTELDQRGWILIAPLGLGQEEPGEFRASWSFQGSTTGLAGPSIGPTVLEAPITICDEALTPDYTYPSCQNVAQSSCSWTHCLGDDIDFVLTLIDAAKKKLSIDHSRIFAMGGSNGGQLIWELAQNLRSASYFRAFSSLIGLPHLGFNSPPPVNQAKPMLLITGSRDTTVPPGRRGELQFTTTSNGEAYFYESASAVSGTWARALNCDLMHPQPTWVESTPLECSTWAGCQQSENGPSIADCRAPQMGHAYDLSTTWPLIMNFFAQF